MMFLHLKKVEIQLTAVLVGSVTRSVKSCFWYRSAAVTAALHHRDQMMSDCCVWPDADVGHSSGTLDGMNARPRERSEMVHRAQF